MRYYTLFYHRYTFIIVLAIAYTEKTPITAIQTYFNESSRVFIKSTTIFIYFTASLSVVKLVNVSLSSL